MDKKRVHIRLAQTSGDAYLSARLRLKLIVAAGTPTYASYQLIPAELTAQTNLSGYARLDVYVNETVSPGSHYQLDMLTMAGLARYHFVVTDADDDDLEWSDLRPKAVPTPHTPTYLEDPWN